MTAVHLQAMPITNRSVGVAYSGGRDSTALLHATLAAAEPLGLHVFALHVHHGLSAHADAWLAHCTATCARWARCGRRVTFVAQRVTDKPIPGQSVEAWAREQRYAALRALALAQGVSLVLLAQHQQDQAETFLLQALRGAGVAGLSGMARLAQEGRIAWARPWLGRPREAIESYLRTHRLRFIDDDSNADPRFARNLLRLQIWPEFVRAFPGAQSALAQSAAWLQEAGACLDELATLDTAHIASTRGLHVGSWKMLSPPRRSNALRAWLRAASGRAAPASLVLRLLAELEAARSASWPCHDGLLRLYRGALQYQALPQIAQARPAREAQLSVRRCGVYKLPGWAGQLRVQRTVQGGVPLAWLAQLELRERRGGEQFQAGLGRPPRSLKKQYQAAAIAPWLRDGPLVYSGGQLVYVPGLGIDARVLALPGQPQVTLRWELPASRPENAAD
jgi:tRNA(Ile)-lysidine synthase